MSCTNPTKTSSWEKPHPPKEETLEERTNAAKLDSIIDDFQLQEKYDPQLLINRIMQTGSLGAIRLARILTAPIRYLTYGIAEAYSQLIGFDSTKEI